MTDIIDLISLVNVFENKASEGMRSGVKHSMKLMVVSNLCFVCEQKDFG